MGGRRRGVPRHSGGDRWEQRVDCSIGTELDGDSGRADGDSARARSDGDVNGGCPADSAWADGNGHSGAGAGTNHDAPGTEDDVTDYGTSAVGAVDPDYEAERHNRAAGGDLLRELRRGAGSGEGTAVRRTAGVLVAP